MSLINDALKRARQAAPGQPPQARRPQHLIVEESSSLPDWLIPSAVMILIMAATFFMGWAVAHRSVHNIIAAPNPTPATPPAPKPAIPPAPSPVASPAPSPVASPAASPAAPPAKSPAKSPVAKPANPPAAQTVKAAAAPSIAKPQPAAPLPPLNPPEAPELQGIFYSATAPTAIVDGRTVRPGDACGIWRVKSIDPRTVTLIGPDKKLIRIGIQ